MARNWILDPYAVCPPSVDNKILTLMHDQKVYHPESQDPKLIKLINQLRDGLDLEGFENYNIIEERVLAEINVLARELYAEKFLVQSASSTGQYCQAEEFRQCWESKAKFWRDSPPSSSGTAGASNPRPKTTSTSDAVDHSADVFEDLFVGPTPTPPPVPNSMANEAYKTVHTFKYLILTSYWVC